MEKLDLKIERERAEKSIVANEKEVLKWQQNRKLLRYCEMLNLNRKGHTHAFKAITRRKRDSTLDGSGVAQDEPKPSLGQYRPRFSLVEP